MAVTEQQLINALDEYNRASTQEKDAKGKAYRNLIEECSTEAGDVLQKFKAQYLGPNGLHGLHLSATKMPVQISAEATTQANASNITVSQKRTLQQKINKYINADQEKKQQEALDLINYVELTLPRLGVDKNSINDAIRNMTLEIQIQFDDAFKKYSDQNQFVVPPKAETSSSPESDPFGLLTTQPLPSASNTKDNDYSFLPDDPLDVKLRQYIDGSNPFLTEEILKIRIEQATLEEVEVPSSTCDALCKFYEAKPGYEEHAQRAEAMLNSVLDRQLKLIQEQSNMLQQQNEELRQKNEEFEQNNEGAKPVPEWMQSILNHIISPEQSDLTYDKMAELIKGVNDVDELRVMNDELGKIDNNMDNIFFIVSIRDAITRRIRSIEQPQNTISEDELNREIQQCNTLEALNRLIRNSEFDIPERGKFLNSIRVFIDLTAMDMPDIEVRRFLNSIPNQPSAMVSRINELVEQRLADRQAFHQNIKKASSMEEVLQAMKAFNQPIMNSSKERDVRERVEVFISRIKALPNNGGSRNQEKIDIYEMDITRNHGLREKLKTLANEYLTNQASLEVQSNQEEEPQDQPVIEVQGILRPSNPTPGGEVLTSFQNQQSQASQQNLIKNCLKNAFPKYTVGENFQMQKTQTEGESPSWQAAKTGENLTLTKPEYVKNGEARPARKIDMTKTDTGFKLSGTGENVAKDIGKIAKGLQDSMPEGRHAKFTVNAASSEKAQAFIEKLAKGGFNVEQLNIKVGGEVRNYSDFKESLGERKAQFEQNIQAAISERTQKTTPRMH